MIRKRILLGVGVVAAAGLLAVGCSDKGDDEAAAAANEVTVTAADFSFSGLENLSRARTTSSSPTPASRSTTCSS
ncbi:MAG: hypothetical protein H6675_02200 [Dehalococcoidia bacterium]|nr:hypothetical protein [Dehalococcoidia bacterium]